MGPVKKTLLVTNIHSCKSPLQLQENKMDELTMEYPSTMNLIKLLEITWNPTNLQIYLINLKEV